jgi:hypothetical protein
MTDNLIERLNAATEGTTPGPWRVHDAESMGDRCCNYYMEIWSSDYDILVATEVTRAHNDGGVKNMRFIAAARQLVPEAAAALAAKDAEIARYRTALALIAAEASVSVQSHGNGINWRVIYEAWRAIAAERIDIARAALTGEKGNGK